MTELTKAQQQLLERMGAGTGSEIELVEGANGSFCRMHGKIYQHRTFDVLIQADLVELTAKKKGELKVGDVFAMYRLSAAGWAHLGIQVPDTTPVLKSLPIPIPNLNFPMPQELPHWHQHRTHPGMRDTTPKRNEAKVKKARKLARRQRILNAQRR